MRKYLPLILTIMLLIGGAVSIALGVYGRDQALQTVSNKFPSRILPVEITMGGIGGIAALITWITTTYFAFNMFKQVKWLMVAVGLLVPIGIGVSASLADKAKNEKDDVQYTAFTAVAGVLGAIFGVGCLFGLFGIYETIKVQIRRQ